MDNKLLRFFVTLFMLTLSGCASAPHDGTGAMQPVMEPDVESHPSPEQVPEQPEPADGNDVMTLTKALSLALVHNPELKVFAWEVRAAEARALQVGLWPNPEIGINIENVAGTNGISGLDGRTTTLQLGQLLELGGKRAKRTTVASLEKEISQWDYEAKRLEVFSAVVKAFVEALAAQERLSLAEDMGKLSGELVETVSQRVEAGKDSPVEKAKAGVVLSNARIRRQQALKNLEFSYKQLAATWGSTSPRFKKVSGVLSVTPVPAIEELSALLEWNPSIVRSSLAVDRQKAALELEKAKVISDVTLSGGVRRFEQTDDGAMVFGFAMPIPLLNRNQGGRLEATHNLAKAREEDRAVRVGLGIELAAAYQALSSAHAEVSELDANVLQDAQSLFEASREGYSQGKLDYLDLLDAQRTLFEVRERYIEAIRSYHLAKADVDRLIKRDLSTLPGARETKLGRDNK